MTLKKTDFFLKFSNIFFTTGICLLSVFCLTAYSQEVLVLSSSSPNAVVSQGSDFKIYGSNAPNQITLESGASAELVNFPGFNTVLIQSNSNAFQVSRSGNVVTFQGSEGTVLKIPATTSIQSINFEDIAPLTLSIYEGQVMLDDLVIDTTPVAISSDDFNGEPEVDFPSLGTWNWDLASGEACYFNENNPYCNGELHPFVVSFWAAESSSKHAFQSLGATQKSCMITQKTGLAY